MDAGLRLLLGGEVASVGAQQVYRCERGISRRRSFAAPDGLMATVTMESPEVSPGTKSRDVSPHTTSLAIPENETKKRDGYVSSPLRASTRLSSIDTVKALPQIPMQQRENVGKGTSESDRTSFPFNAQPGSQDPTPTTTDLAKGAAKGDDTTSRAQPGTATPSVRRSVNFVRTESEREEPAPLAKTTTWETEENEDGAASKERQGSFFGKLRALASSSSSGHIRSASNTTAGGIGTPHSALSPQSERSEPSFPLEPSEAIDADVEESEEVESEDVESSEPRSRRKRKRRPRPHASGSAPNTPIRARFEHRFASFMREQSADNTGEGPSGRPAVSRRNTTGSSDNERAGVSEDEGRDRIRNAWRRGIEGARGLSYGTRKHNEDGDNDSPDTRRPNHLRRITGMMDGTHGDSPFRRHADRQMSSSAQKWRQVKAGLKMLGQRRKEERMRVDHQKSAQLVAELLAGAPAALVFASMYQRDENNHRKIPVLLEQLKIKITDSVLRHDKKDSRHLVFKIDLEYGNGATRMRWTISRSLHDFVNLHLKYQATKAKDKLKHLSTDSTSRKHLMKMPRFPRSAFPYARQWRGLFDDLEEEEEESDKDDADMAPQTPGLEGLPEIAEVLSPGPEISMAPGPTTPGPSLGPPGQLSKHKRKKSSIFTPTALRRTSTGDLGRLPDDPDELEGKQREIYQRRQRNKLQIYLQNMVKWLIFRPDSTRLCKFLEVSAMAIRLSAESGYQGKQGLMTIASRSERELRRKPLSVADFKRAKPRWFLVRHSYIVCVDGPESLVPYDVFLVDSDFSTEKRKHRLKAANGAAEAAKSMAESAADKADKMTTTHQLIRLYNAERKMRLIARTERQANQFQESINQMAEATVWSRKQRFASYAPVRNNVWCRWLVDGRDHMWQVSRAIDSAKDFIYLHDWWLSPELYMRRPAAISQKWRLDRLLQRKASEGVKIFVIVYRNIESAIPIDSEYTKWSLLDLHENICIQRSPNQFRQNQFFWSHHEKLVVVDNMMAFVGGVDLCFGRWDEPCHSLTDDKLTGFEIDHVGPRDSEHCQVWPGKDYSNPRVQDFYALDRPYEEMYDRTKVPRMPWHDISMQIVGQPARDVGRHFVQRWNYILRSKGSTTRPTPVLIPPPDYEQSELEDLGMTGTCQVQILRSASSWSIGTPNKVERSILNAYVDLIKHSKHFVYIENQFFITSCTVEGTAIHNGIGDALVERIIRAHEEGENWGACLVVPLMPGYQNSVDSQDGTSVRLIMQCQFRSICSGESSIWGRLKARDIEPEDYIRFYALRQWGKIGPRKCLTTEQLYIHAKCMVVDDRTAIIGSANINERSLLGFRDSEVAAVVTDTKMMPSSMGGEPFEVGEFPHTLRMRLMREHLGIDVDAIYRREQLARERDEQDREMERIYREETHHHYEREDYFSTPPVTPGLGSLPLPQHGRSTEVSSAGHGSSGTAETTAVGSAVSLEGAESRPSGSAKEKDKCTNPQQKQQRQRDLDVDGFGFDNMHALVEDGDYGLTDSFIDANGREVLVKKDAPDVYRITSAEDKEPERSASQERKENRALPKPPYPTERMDTYALGLPPRSQLPELPTLDDTDIGGPALTRGVTASSGGTKSTTPLLHSIRRAEIDEDCMVDPLVSTFWHDIWHHVAENNTKIYRQVFRCMPDSEVRDWKDYERFNDYNERFMQSQGLGSSKPSKPKDAPGKSGPPGSGGSAGTTATSGSTSAAVGDFTRPRGKSMLGTLADRLRAGSRASEEQTHVEEMKEKEATAAKEKQGTGNADTPDTVASTAPTAVPSPAPGPLDEKEAVKAADQEGVATADQLQTSLSASEKPASDPEKAAEEKQMEEKESNAITRPRTVTYSQQVNQAPETTATQTLTNGSGGGIHHSGSQKRRRRATTKSNARAVPEDVLSYAEAEELLNMVQGHVVLWPYDWYVVSRICVGI